MFFRQLLNDESACASYLLGCKSRGQLAVVDPHTDLVDQYIALAEAQEVPIAAVFETHVQADHVSGLPDLVARTGATAYLPEGAGVDFDHRPLADAEIVHLGNTEFKAIATPDTLRRITRTWSPTTPEPTTRGWSSPATPSSSATPAGRICTPMATTASRRWHARCIAR